ncbi:helix-turn-helix domain-containing protein [Deinococcus arenicola]|uniref:helix-turn-helix domain-containing protein n=1 Tax=Deinococcus arenicola TaxID=2994950 RepID=UPI003D678DBB
MTDKFITSIEVGQILGISRMTVNRWARAGKLPCIKANEEGQRVRYMFIESTIKALVN